MIKVKVSELSGPALDWAVATALDYKPILESESTGPDFWMCQVPWGGYAEIGGEGFSPSSDWSQGGPIIENHNLEIIFNKEGAWASVKMWSGDHYMDDDEFYPSGETILIAACRGIVTAKIGEEIEIPEELLTAEVANGS